MSGIIFFGKEAVTMKNKLLFTLCIAGSLLLGGCAARSESKAQTETVTLAPAYENLKKAAENGEPVTCTHSRNYTEPSLSEGDYYPNGDKNAKYHIHISGGSSGTMTYEGDLYECIINHFDYYEPMLRSDAPERDLSDPDIEKFMSAEGYREVENILKYPCRYTVRTRHDLDDLTYVYVDFPDYFSDECLKAAGHTRVFTDFFFADNNNFGYPRCQYIKI